MRVLGISSSPRRSGNSEMLLDKALEGASQAGASIEKIVLNEFQIKPCQECGLCDESGICVIADDMARIYKEMDMADACIIASPVFFASLTAQAKSMIDRFQCAWVAKYVLKKVLNPRKRRGVFLCVSGSFRKDHFENAKSIVRAFFATNDIEYSGQLFCGGMSDMALVDRDEKSLREAYALGRALVKPDERSV